MKKIFVSCLIFSCLQTKMVAQYFYYDDFISNTGIEISKKVGRNTDLSLSEEIRLSNFSTHYKRSKTSLDISRPAFRKKVKWGASYAFLNRENNKYYLENQHRLSAQFRYRDKIQNRYKYSAQFKLQSTFRDENKGDYKVNPKLYLRNKYQFAYNIPFSKIEPSFSFEYFCALNDREKYVIDKLRYTLSIDYILSRVSSLEFYLRVEDEIQVKNPEHNLSLGIFYKYKLR